MIDLFILFLIVHSLAGLTALVLILALWFFGKWRHKE